MSDVLKNILLSEENYKSLINFGVEKINELTADFADFSEYRWVSALENVAKKRFEKTLEELIRMREPYELAQIMLKNPANSALELYRS